MHNRRMAGRAGALRLAGGAAAVGLAVSGCSGSEPTGSPTGTGSEEASAAPSSTTPKPEESVALYTLDQPKSGVEGKRRKANEALRGFAESMSSGQRREVEEVLFASTPQDQTILDESLRVYEGATWDFSGIRWTEQGVNGPCYLLEGTVDGEPVHMTGWATWNDTIEEWQFGTAGLPGSEEYPRVPDC